MEEEKKKLFVRVGHIYLIPSNIVIDTYSGDKKVYNYYTTSPYIVVDAAFSKYKIVPIDSTEICVLTTTDNNDFEEITKEQYIELFGEAMNYYQKLLDDNTV